MTTTYQTIANEVLSTLPTESKNYQTEVCVGALTIFIDVDYNVEYKDVIGGEWDEILSEVDYESIEVLSATAYDNDTDLESELNISMIESLLN